MSVWNDTRLHNACIERAPLVTPYEAANVNPASIDLRLGAAYRLPAPYWPAAPWTTLDLPHWGDEEEMPATGYALQPGQFILCCTLETVAIPLTACAELYSKSSTGRTGLEHLHAGWIDPGFRGQLTLEFHNVAPWPILLTPGKRYMQMVVHDLAGPAARGYAETGRYQGQTGATPAREARQ